MAVDTLDFEPVRPCTFRSGLVVRRVFVDFLPGSVPEPQISFSVERGDESAFILSQTRAELPFTAIPRNTHRLSAAGRIGSGFAGPGGSGHEIAYLPWRIGEVTHELSAALRPWLTERDVQAIAAALVALHAEAGAGPAP